MVNISRLQAALKKKNISYENAANAIGINTATFYRRMNRKGEKFTVKEVGKLADLLHMDADTMQEIFFDKALADMQETEGM